MIGRTSSTVEYASEESSPWGALKLIAGEANPELAHRIAEGIGVPLTDARVKRFSDGEIDVKIQDSMRGHDVFVIQPTCHPVNENLMELFIILDALRRASAGRVTAVIPYYGYARKERKSQPREPITAKLIANIVTLAGADRVLLLDLHTEAIEGFFDVPTDHLTAHKILAEYLRTKRVRDMVVVAPDVGGVKRARSLATLLGVPIAIIDKRRPMDEETEVLNVVGEVDGRDCVIVDDMITTGGTISAASHALKAAGAGAIYAAATHAVFTGNAVENLRGGAFQEIVVTDSIPLPADKQGAPVTVLSVAPLLAEAIIRVHENRSVSELFR
ncbi:MAG: ribose-phosphate pyrophosphokinase [Candidatus Dormibacteraeota bacterium]|nr:ribose-phosphate pyrophosphokinase [Candidatus Dormibacteraeota bacterium]